MAAIPLLINILFAALLVVGGLVTLPSDSGAGALPDGILHGLAYGLQTALLFWLFSSARGPGRAIIAAVVCATLFGAMVETLQFLQPARTVELGDLLANAVGACVIGTVIALVGRSRS